MEDGASSPKSEMGAFDLATAISIRLQAELRCSLRSRALGLRLDFPKRNP